MRDTEDMQHGVMNVVEGETAGDDVDNLAAQNSNVTSLDCEHNYSQGFRDHVILAGVHAVKSVSKMANGTEIPVALDFKGIHRNECTSEELPTSPNQSGNR